MHLRMLVSILTIILGVGLNPATTFACGRSTFPNSPKVTPKIRISDWRKQFNFTEQISSHPVPKAVSYSIQLSQMRCIAMYSRVVIKEPLTSMDLHLEVLAIDSNTIGLYFLADRSKIKPPKPKFKSGDLLLRIQKTIPQSSSPSMLDKPIYRIYFEKLSPALSEHKSNGLEIVTPLD